MDAWLDALESTDSRRLNREVEGGRDTGRWRGEGEVEEVGVSLRVVDEE